LFGDVSKAAHHSQASMKRKNSALEHIKKKIKIESYLLLLPRELLDNVFSFLDFRSRITLRSTYNIEPRASTVLSESPWPIIFRNYDWIENMIVKYQATPLLIGSSLDKEKLTDSTTRIALYIGAKRTISREDRDLFFKSLPEQFYTRERGEIMIFEGTFLNVGDLYNSEEQTLLYQSSSEIKFMRRFGTPQYSFYKTQRVQNIESDSWFELRSEPLLIRVKFSHDDPIRSLCLEENKVHRVVTNLGYSIMD
jgi:hypothetical protein